MNSIFKIPTPYSHTLVEFSTPHGVQCELAKTKISGINRLFSITFTLYPGSESNRYGRNGHRILSPLFPVKKPP